MERLPKTFVDILDAIDESLHRGRLIPVLILVYSGIDNISNLVETENKPAGQIFKDWVKRWMLTKYPLPCNELDIWSARCGLVHQQVSESNLTRGGSAKEIFYSHGGADPEDLQLVISKARRNAVTVVIEDLIYSFKNGMIDCVNEIENDPIRKNSFEMKVAKLFVSVTPKQ